MEKARIRKIDIARGIAMICIMLGHTGNNYIVKVVYTFHLAIFFLISGYFFKENKNDKEFIKEKIKRLLIPYFVVALFLIFIDLMKATIKNNFQIENILDWIKATLYGAGLGVQTPFGKVKNIGAIWFLLATFWSELFLKYILKIKNKIIQPMVVIAIFIIGYYSNKLFFYFPFSIQSGCLALLYMYIGYHIKQFNEKYFDIINNHGLSIDKKIIIIFLALGMWLWMVINYNGFVICSLEIGNGFADIIGSLCGCYLLMLMSEFIDRKLEKISEILSFYGKYSLLFLCIHLVELDFFGYRKLFSYITKGVATFGGLYLTYVIIMKLIIITCLLLIATRVKLIRKIFGYKVYEK